MKLSVKLLIFALFFSAFAAAAAITKKQCPIVFRAKTEAEKIHPFCTIGVSEETGTVSGHRVGIRNIFINFKTSFPYDQICAIRAAGALPMVTWEPYTQSLRTENIMSDIAAGKYDGYITRFAQESGQDPLLIRFAHEPNGDWYGWSGVIAGTAAYVAAFRHVRDIFNKQNSTAKFVFCVNAEDVPDNPANRFENYYPGPEYADAIGIDAYNEGAGQGWRRWKSPGEMLTPAYERAVRAFPGKPLLLTETASSSSGGDKANWIKSLTSQLGWRFPAIKAVIWFNMDKEQDWALDSEAEADTFYGACRARICCTPDEITRLFWGNQ